MIILTKFNEYDSNCVAGSIYINKFFTYWLWFQGTRSTRAGPGNSATPHVRGPRRPIQADVAIDMDAEENSHLLSDMNDKGLFWLSIAIYSQSSSGQNMSDILRLNCDHTLCSCTNLASNISSPGGSLQAVLP